MAKRKKQTTLKLPSLDSWNEAKENAGEEGSGFEEFPDGTYRFVITGAKVAESANGRTQVNWEFKFADGEFDGKIYRDYQGIDNAESLTWMMGRLTKLGYETPDSPNDLSATLEEIVGEELEVLARLKSKGEYQNLWIQKLVGGEEPEEEGEEKEGEESEGDGEEEGESEIEIGSTVTLNSEDNSEEYEVTAIKGEKVSIKDGDGEQYEIALSDCVLVEPEEGEEDPEEDGMDAKVGDRVCAKNKKGTLIEGELKRISRDGTKVSIEDDDGTVHRAIPVENVSGEPPEEPKKTSKKKVKKTSVRKKKGGK